MEFPHIGQHCSEKSCRRLDFLPVTCDSCKQTFCSEHFIYDKHSCTVAQQKDVQVPVCPLCGEPVPTPRNTSPDVTVGRHIDESCQQKKTKIYTNKCTFGTCKKKELVPFLCSVCKQNFCISHRHTADHKCEGPKSHQRNVIAQAAISRQSNTKAPRRASTNQIQSVQGNMTEDEAFAHALALSIQEHDEESNRNLRTVPVTAAATAGGGAKDKCALS